jgi:hypothetical protein
MKRQKQKIYFYAYSEILHISCQARFGAELEIGPSQFPLWPRPLDATGGGISCASFLRLDCKPRVKTTDFIDARRSSAAPHIQ